MRQADVHSVKQSLLQLCGAADEHRLVVYGELMCNAQLYDYREHNLPGMWLPFGAMISSSSNAAQTELARC